METVTVRNKGSTVTVTVAIKLCKVKVGPTFSVAFTVTEFQSQLQL